MDQTPQMIFLNVITEDVPRARAFWTALGYGFDERFCNADGLCLVISDTIHAMLLTREKFEGFAGVPAADPRETKECLICLNRDSRAAVDAITEKALAAGGDEPRPAMDYGWMYGRAFQDPDGHTWEMMWMDLEAFMKATQAEAAPA